MTELLWNIASFSHVGHRTLNEDAVGVRRVKSNKRSYHVLVAADGVGSAKGSGALSALVTQEGLFSIENFMSSRTTKRDLNSEDVEAMIARISCDLQKIDLEQKLATTLVCAVLGKRTLAVVWAGDSRAYSLSKSGQLRMLTQDHTSTDGAICTFVRGDGQVNGELEGAVYSADDLQLLAVVTDGVYNSCSEGEFRAFLLYAASCLGFRSDELGREFTEFAGSNISDNATMGIILSPRHLLRIQKAAYRIQMENK